jgi:hypothetical protein
MQNFIPLGLSDPQCGQRMGEPSGTAVRVVGHVWAAARRPSLIGMGWMVCQYSRPSQVSSEKHRERSALKWRGEVVTGTATVVMGDYWTRAERYSICRAII